MKQQYGSCVAAASALSCPADGSSLPSHVSHNAGILSFHKVSRSDSGNYTCIASNRPQGEIRATVQLVVAGEEGSGPGRGWPCLGGRESNVWPDPEPCPVALECLVCQCFACSLRGHVPLCQRWPCSLVGA